MIDYPNATKVIPAWCRCKATIQVELLAFQRSNAWLTLHNIVLVSFRDMMRSMSHDVDGTCAILYSVFVAQTSVKSDVEWAMERAAKLPGPGEYSTKNTGIGGMLVNSGQVGPCESH